MQVMLGGFQLWFYPHIMFMGDTSTGHCSLVQSGNSLHAGMFEHKVGSMLIYSWELHSPSSWKLLMLWTLASKSGQGP